MRYNRIGAIAATLAAAFAAAPLTSQAADGLITLTGMLAASTCKISGNGGGSDFTVALPTVSASSLSAPNMAAGRTPFNIVLSGCTPSAGNVQTYFEEGSPMIDATTGWLKNSGTAQNVQVSLLNDDFTKIVLGADKVSQSSKAVALTEGNATLNYFAQYVAQSGRVVAGTVNTAVLYSIVYQ
jgi:major type 1 subunit fimbrin (pilin)